MTATRVDFGPGGEATQAVAGSSASTSNLATPQQFASTKNSRSETVPLIRPEDG